MSHFRVVATSGHARAGALTTRHGEVETPAFMPVATQASVKALSPAEVAGTGARLVIMNTYHLWLRPGPEIVHAHGGLHEFARWPHSIATDSGGFQAYSIAQRFRETPDGFELSSHLDGSRRLLTPEESLRVQVLLGTDIALQLDVCPPAGAPRRDVERAIDRTTVWAKRSLAARPEGQVLYGIVQGGTDVELRLRHAAELAALPLDGLALGGFSVGEAPARMHETLGAVVPYVDAARPRYLMGVGTPSDLVRAIVCGVDLFDCVMPTRNARNGQAFVRGGRLVIKNSRYKDDPSPIEPGCRCPACAGGFGRAYLRHLFQAGEILAHRLLTLHNLHHYQELVREGRAAIQAGEIEAWARSRLGEVQAPEPADA